MKVKFNFNSWIEIFITFLGVIHSDIKPGNFLVVGCEVKLIDFNISNTISDKTSITLTNDCGTLHYMAPETLLRDNDSKTRVK